jgi:aspartate oxidase
MNQDGSFTTIVEKYTCEVVREGNSSSVKIQPKVELVKFNSSNVVLATGGRQKIKKS